MIDTKWFSQEYGTIELAQLEACDEPQFFERYGIFETRNHGYVWANLNLKEWTHVEVAELAREIERLTGNKLVSYTSALFGWVDWKG